MPLVCKFNLLLVKLKKYFGPNFKILLSTAILLITHYFWIWSVQRRFNKRFWDISGYVGILRVNTNVTDITIKTLRTFANNRWTLQNPSPESYHFVKQRRRTNCFPERVEITDKRLPEEIKVRACSEFSAHTGAVSALLEGNPGVN